MITRDEYIKQIHGDILTDGIKEYEYYITDSIKYKPYLSDANINELDKYNDMMKVISEEPNPNENTKHAIEAYNENSKRISLQDMKAKKEREKENQLVLKKNLHDGTNGFANALAIIFVVANLGLFLAFLLLMTK